MSEYEGECDMTPTQLAALVLAIGIYETNPIGNRSTARSLMFVSRTDNPYRAYANNDRPTETDPGTEPKRAFWHPGVGYWQLDFWPNELNHAERADVNLGGYAVAKRLGKAYCGPKGDETKLRNSLHIASWNGCKPIATDAQGTQLRHSDRTPIRVCFNAYKQLYLGGDLGDPAYKGAEGLWATASGNEDLLNTKGGAHGLSCRWGTGAKFKCWLYDTEDPEGHISDYDPEGDDSDAYKTRMVCPNNAKECPAADKVPKLVCPNKAEECADEDKVPERYKFRSPLAAPFISFTDEDADGEALRFAVFPESLAGGSVTWFKHVPIDNDSDPENDHLSRVRTAPGNTWNQEAFDIDGDGDRDELRVEDCTQRPGEGPTPLCPWVDVASSGFNDAVRRSFPS